MNWNSGVKKDARTMGFKGNLAEIKEICISAEPKEGKVYIKNDDMIRKKMAMHTGEHRKCS